MAATKRNAAGLTSAVPRATLNDEELVRIRPLTTLLSGIIVIFRVVYLTIRQQSAIAIQRRIISQRIIARVKNDRTPSSTNLSRTLFNI